LKRLKIGPPNRSRNICPPTVEARANLWPGFGLPKSFNLAL
jgi:hypothetical protein